MKTRILFCKGEVRTIEDVIEAWKEEHHDTRTVRHLEDVIRKCADLNENFRAWHEELWQSASSGTLTNAYYEGETLMTWFDRSLRALASVQPWITWAENRGYVVDGAGEYHQAVEVVQRMREDFSKRWPFFDLQQVEEARAEIARDEYQTAEEILSELQGIYPK
jgi:hypothetical protein